jgi:hypothetical protein
MGRSQRQAARYGRCALAIAVGCAAAVAAVDPGSWTLRKLDLAVYPAAKCLDGTPGALYVSPSPTGSKSWVFHLQGGE